MKVFLRTVQGIAVLELGRLKIIFSWAWNSHDPITDYALRSEMLQWDKFAEAVSVAVFGQAYEQRTQLRFLVSAREWQDQATRMLELLNGLR